MHEDGPHSPEPPRRRQAEPTGDTANRFWVTSGELLQDHEPPHEVRDTAKLDGLLLSMVRGGWDEECPPLVREGRFLVTGSHRYAAVECLQRFLAEYGESRHQDGLEVQMVELDEIFEVEADLDFEEMCERYGHPIVCQDPMYAQMLDELPTEILERYGLDLH